MPPSSINAVNKPLSVFQRHFYAAHHNAAYLESGIVFADDRINTSSASYIKGYSEGISNSYAGRKVSLGQYRLNASGNSVNIDVKNHISVYSRLSVSNFAFNTSVFMSGDFYTNAGNSGATACINSYNPSTGILTISASSPFGHCSKNCYTDVTVCCIY